jgi:transcription termination factor Rho
MAARADPVGSGAAVSVLQRKQLEDSPLADLHAIASELGVEGFRAMRKDDLIGAILRAQGADDEAESATAIEEPEPDEVPAEEALEGPAGKAPSAPTAEVAADEERAAEAEAAEGERAEAEVEGEPAEAEAAPAEPEAAEAAAEAQGEPAEEEAEGEPAEAEAAPAEPEAAEAAAEAPEEEAEAAPEVEPTVTGVLDILANGSGFVRVDPAGQSRDDVYVAPAQIRRCELRAGDEVGGPVRPPRRNERHPSLVRIESVNGAEAEPPEQRPWFGDLTPVFPSVRLPAPSSLKSAPFGRGSRVLIAGPPGAGATSLLREIADGLAKLDDTASQVVLVGVRPEEVTEWRRLDGVSVLGGSFDRSPETQAQAAELAAERAKRLVERGHHAALLIDSLDALPATAQRRVFGAARATEEGGTLTVVATADAGSQALRWATTRIVLEPSGKPARGESGTLNADRLG